MAETGPKDPRRLRGGRLDSRAFGMTAVAFGAAAGFALATQKSIHVADIVVIVAVTLVVLTICAFALPPWRGSARSKPLVIAFMLLLAMACLIVGLIAHSRF